jgi:hypothetical protein
MNRFECSLCSKGFTTKSRLDYHINHDVCQHTKSKICGQCGRTFKRIQSLEYHQTHHVCLRKPKIFLAKKQPVDTHDEVTQLKLEIESLRGENKTLREHSHTTNPINVITDFNTEKITDILCKDPNLINDTIKHHLNEAIPYLTKKIHCNPIMFPTYTNMFITKYHSPYIMVYCDGCFRRENKAYVLDKIITKFIHILESYVNVHDFDHEIFEQYEHYRDSVIEGGEKRKDLEDELIGLLIDFCELYKMDQIAVQTRNEYTSNITINMTS